MLKTFVTKDNSNNYKQLCILFTFFVWIIVAHEVLFSETIGQNKQNMRIISDNSSYKNITSVAFTGIDSTLMLSLKEQILSSTGGELNDGLVDHDIKTITKVLREQGWWDANVTANIDLKKEEHVKLTFSVVLKKRVAFGKISITTEDDILQQQNSLSEVYGKPFSKNEIESLIVDIVTLYTENGYPDATVNPYLYAKKDTVDVLFTIAAGKPAFIDSIIIGGLKKTNDRVVLRELSHIRGMPADQKTIGYAQDALQTLNFLQPAKPPAIDFSQQGSAILVLDLLEKGFGSFNGVVGYQPSDEGTSGELIGTINLNLTNMFGTGRSSSIRWEKLGGSTEDLEIGYHEPRLFGLPYSVSTGFVQEEREQHGFTKTKFDLKIIRRIGHFTIDTGFRYDKVSADSLTSSTAAGIKAAMTWNGLDNRENPRIGLHYNASWSLMAKNYRFRPDDRSTIDNVEVNLDNYIPTLKRQTVAFLIRYRRVDTDKKTIDLSDRYWLGGASSIRGYSEQQFPAVKALWSSLEYRFLTGGTSRFFIFIDAGYLINQIGLESGDVTKERLTRIGYGFGLRIQSRAGTLGFDYGLGKDDSPGQGKLHVRLSADF